MSESRAAYFREYQGAAGGKSERPSGLLPFQQSFVDAVCRVNHPPDIAALSLSHAVTARAGFPAKLWRGL